MSLNIRPHVMRVKYHIRSYRVAIVPVKSSFQDNGTSVVKKNLPTELNKIAAMFKLIVL